MKVLAITKSNDINSSIKSHKIHKWCEINNYRITKISKLFSPHSLESIEGIIAETFFDLYQNIFSFGKMVELVNKYGLFIHCMDGFDSRTTFGKNVLKMLLKFCEIEKSDLANRTLEGRMNNFSRFGKVGGIGKGSTGKPPFGYYWDGDVLEVDSQKSQWVKRIYDFRHDGVSYRKIANIVNEAGVVTNNGKPFSRRAIKSILNNNFYSGHIHYSNQIIQNHHKPVL
jgi:hypothetical protein